MGRARLCLSLHLVTPLRKLTWSKLRKSRVYVTSHFGVPPGVVRGGSSATLSCKVDTESGTHFFICAGRKNNLIAPKTPKK